MSKFVIGIIGITVLILVIGVVLTNSSTVTTKIDPQTLQTEMVIQVSDWVKGPENAKATLIEYSDFQCPACASYFPLINKLAEEMGEEIQVIYRHYPLSSIHPQAQLAAQAAEAA